MTSTISTAQESEQPSVISVKHIPTDIDGNKIEWDDNPAYLAGALYECSLFYERTGLFEALIKDGAVARSRMASWPWISDCTPSKGFLQHTSVGYPTFDDVISLASLV